MAELYIRYFEGDQLRQRPDRSHYAVSVVIVSDTTWYSGYSLMPEVPQPVLHELPGHRDYALFLWEKKSLEFPKLVDRLFDGAQRKHAQTVTIVIPLELHRPIWGRARIVTDVAGRITDSGFESVTLAFRRECPLSLALAKQ